MRFSKASAVLGALFVLALSTQAHAATVAETNTFAPNGWSFTTETGSNGAGWFDGGVPCRTASDTAASR